VSLFRLEHIVSFGDCDPAGIVFYPNFYRWIDACFHGYVRALGVSHAVVCEELGARGLGLMETGMSFRAPARDGDALAISLDGIDWSGRSYRASYTARVGETLIFEAFETRGVFVEEGGRLRAAPVAPLRRWLG
jgi:4-hydroxybenzoyl-CoA thioesterase